MKKVVFLLFATFFLAGCSLTDSKIAFENFINGLLQQDQAHEQGFVLTASEVSQRFYRDETGIDLSKLGLTAVPDLCALVNPDEYDLVRFLDLSQNKIKIVDQDLSCFQYLQVINLAYNEIQEVVSLGTLPRLKDLRLQKNQLTSTENFPELTWLSRLNLSYNQIAIVQDLEKLTNLKELELQHNVIEQFIGAERMQQLELLKLEFNKLQNVDFLKEITSLFTVSLGGNQLPPEIEAIWKAFSPKFRMGWSGSVASGANETGE
jgi:Leucine-rich repeat (LRR) protein